jgi:hypothetical protein
MPRITIAAADDYPMVVVDINSAIRSRYDQSQVRLVRFLDRNE